MERFMERVSPEALSGCWLWAGATHGETGYGGFKWGARKSKTETTHRVAYKLFKGDIPKGLLVLHSCDVRMCVNPDHLRLGTHKDNSGDAVKRDRTPRGERVKSAVLTEAQVLECKQSDESTKVLAERFGCSRQNIADIRYGRTWRHLS